MAGGMDLGTGGRGGKKPLDAAINLVPFIDLMAVTISFLIMTAVWTQIGRLQVSSAGSGETDPLNDETKTVPLILVLTERELRLTAGGQEMDVLKRDAAGKFDFRRLKADFEKVRQEIPEQNQITVQTDDSVPYEDLVRVIDECVGDQLPNVTVSPIGGGGP
jgi:biopolymer transport protein ExbD